jgi:signal transduction histidine kinase/DNA-binding response OmpR family regulator
MKKFYLLTPNRQLFHTMMSRYYLYAIGLAMVVFVGIYGVYSSTANHQVKQSSNVLIIGKYEKQKPLPGTLPNQDTLAKKLFDKGYWELYSGSIDTAVKFFQLAIQKGNNDYAARSYSNLAQIHIKYARLDSALSCAQKMFNVVQKTDAYGLSTSLGWIMNLSDAKPDSKAMDSLIKIAFQHPKLSQNPQELSSIYNVAASHYIRLKDYRKASSLIKQALQDPRLNQNPQGLKSLYGAVVAYYMQLKNYREASVYFQKLLELAEKTQNINDLSNTYRTIGQFLIENSENYEAAIDYQLKSIEFLNKIKDPNKGAYQNRYLLIGNSYHKMGNDSLAILYLKKCLSITGESYYIHSHSDAYNLMGEIAEQKGDFNKAIAYYTKSTELPCRIHPYIGYHNRFINLGNVYLKLADLNKAIRFYEKSLELANKYNANTERAISYYYLGTVYQQTHDLTKAGKYFTTSLDFAKAGNDLTYHQKSAFALGNILMQQHVYKDAGKYLSLSNQLKDSLTSLQKVENISGLGFHLQLSKLVDTIDREKQLSASRLKKQWQIVAFALIVLISLGIILFIVYKSYLRKKRDNLILVEQKKKIEHMNLEITQISQQLHEADQYKLQFFTNISHELRTPLTLMTAPLDKLLKIITNKDQREYLELIQKNNSRLSRLINQLLSLRKIDEKSLRLELKNGNFIAFTKDIISLFQQNAQTNEVNLLFHSNVDDFYTLFDPDKMETVITNLLTNAFKHTSKGGRISVNVIIDNENDIHKKPLSADRGIIKIVVKDTGRGITVDDMDKIFNRFYSVQSDLINSDTDMGSSGIGLNLVKELVVLHKGSITVESEVGTGTTFIVHIPIDEKAYLQDGNADFTLVPNSVHKNLQVEGSVTCYELPSVSGLSDYCILIVEDNTDLRTFLKREISEFARVITAGNGEEGYKKAEQEFPDIILTDVMMPVMDGVEMCRRLKTNVNTSHIPVLMLSAKASVEHQIEGLRTGADDYLSKPFNLDLLLVKINSVLKTREDLRKRYRNELSIMPAQMTVTNADENVLKRMLEVIEENISNPDLSANTFVTEIGMSRSVLYAKLKELTGQSVNEFVRTVKLKKASQVILQNRKTISEVAYMFGFNTPQYFTKCFKEEFGVPPKDFIMRHAEKQI